MRTKGVGPQGLGMQKPKTKKSFKKKESPTKIAPAIIALAPTIIDALSKSNSKKDAGGKTTIVIKNNNQSRNLPQFKSTNNSQADNAIDPNKNN